MDFSPTAEFSLLLSCCRPQAGSETRERQRDLLARIDVAVFLALVDRHRVAPMVCHHLLQLPREIVPAALIAPLRERQQAAVLRQLEMTREQVRLHHLFEAAGIAYVTLKGLPLAQRYYGNAGLRTGKDIDLLVAPARLDTAVATLLAAGYEPDDGFDRITPRQRAHWISAFHHCSFAAPGSGALVELHWRPVNYPDILPAVTTGLASGETDHVALGSVAIPLLPAEDMLLYLCAHGTMHFWFRLKWLFDLPVLLESRDWDWPALFAKAARQRCTGHLALGLLLASQLCDWQPPAVVQAWLMQQRHARRCCQNALDAMLAPETRFRSAPPVSVWLRRVHYHSGFLAWQGVIPYNLRLMSTSVNDWILLPLPDRLFPLYFVLRPLLWLWRRFGQPLQQRAKAATRPAE